MNLMISELDGSEGIYLFLATLSKVIRKLCLEPMILMISWLESSVSSRTIWTDTSKVNEN